MAQKIRIQKALADEGVISRRGAEQLIKSKKITVNGHPAMIGHPIDIANDVVVVDGKRVYFRKKKEKTYIMVNKPRGYVTTTNDELGRKDVTQLVETIEERLYPVGRLDKNTEGLLIMTNDGEFANLIMHPSHHVSKTYRVTVHPDITDEQAARLSAGVDIGDNEVSQPCLVHIMEKQVGRVVLQITISEGKNRQIRRMCEAIGLEVGRLKRISIGPLRLGMLKPGNYRELKKSEIIALRNAAKPQELQEKSVKDDKYDRIDVYGKDGRAKVNRKKGGYKETGRPSTRNNRSNSGDDDYTFKGGYDRTGGVSALSSKNSKNSNNSNSAQSSNRNNKNTKGKKSYDKKEYDVSYGGSTRPSRPSRTKKYNSK